jgi:hypothetical protein
MSQLSKLYLSSFGPPTAYLLLEFLSIYTSFLSYPVPRVCLIYLPWAFLIFHPRLADIELILPDLAVNHPITSMAAIFC